MYVCVCLVVCMYTFSVQVIRIQNWASDLPELELWLLRATQCGFGNRTWVHSMCSWSLPQLLRQHFVGLTIAFRGRQDYLTQALTSPKHLRGCARWLTLGHLPGNAQLSKQLSVDPEGLEGTTF